MREAALKQLRTIQLLVRGLTDEEYVLKQNILSGASIGQHVRHILEFYGCFTESIGRGELCYDNRSRDIRIETNRLFVDKLIDSLYETINTCTCDKSVKLLVDFSSNSREGEWLTTSLFRELAYNVEHGIHHQALIKIGVHQIGRDALLDATFGLAPATIRHRSEKAVHA